MNKLKHYIILFALAVTFASAFIVLSVTSAHASQAVKPWNIDVIIEHNGKSISYNLENKIRGIEDEAGVRGFYSGCVGRKKLAEGLLSTGVERMAVYEYLFPDFTDLINDFKYVERSKIDAETTFSASGFAYSAHQDGVTIDIDKLFALMLKSCGKQIRITLPLIVDKAVTIDEIKQNTVKKSSFTTTYYNSSVNRSFNISLATSALDGLTVAPNDVFSFNDVVGERTEANGYKNAKVIMDGNYTDGVGGGVCQVSTTLYNALLLAGFVPSACQHSLVSSYVMAGFDAMVAYGTSDLKFVNNTSHNIYIQGKTQGKKITFTIYGEPNEYEIVRENVEERQPFGIVQIVDNVKYPELVYTDQTKILVNGSDGVKTKSYLKYYKNGVLIKSKLIRTNNYKKVDKVIACGDKTRPEDNDG